MISPAGEVQITNAKLHEWEKAARVKKCENASSDSDVVVVKVNKRVPINANEKG